MVTVSFLLSLSRLGQLRADFSVLKKGISGAFGVANEENRALVSSRLPELKQRLQAHGFTIYDISLPGSFTGALVRDEPCEPGRCPIVGRNVEFGDLMALFGTVMS